MGAIVVSIVLDQLMSDMCLFGLIDFRYTPVLQARQQRRRQRRVLAPPALPALSARPQRGGGGRAAVLYYAGWTQRGMKGYR